MPESRDIIGEELLEKEKKRLQIKNELIRQEVEATRLRAQAGEYDDEIWCMDLDGLFFTRKAKGWKQIELAYALDIPISYITSNERMSDKKEISKYRLAHWIMENYHLMKHVYQYES